MLRAVLSALLAVLGLWGGARQTACETECSAGVGSPAFALSLLESAPGSLPFHSIVAEQLPGSPACVRRGESSGGDPGRLDPGVIIARSDAASGSRCVSVLRNDAVRSDGRRACGGKGIRGPPRA